MQPSQLITAESTTSSAFERLQVFMKARRESDGHVADFEGLEREVHELFSAAEREFVGEELARADVDVPVLEFKGVAYRNVLRCEETYVTSSGPVRVERSLYAAGRGEHRRRLCPLELRAGIVEERWTPRAAKQAVWAVAQMTPGDAERLFAMLGGMTPSKSSLDRLPKQLSATWEARREDFETELLRQFSVPAEAVSVAVSLDGVMAPMKDGSRREKRERLAAQGRPQCGPAGYREVACGTVSFYDREGERLTTLRAARMPEPRKASLKASLTAVLAYVLTKRPDLQVVKVADGAKDNWRFLAEQLPDGEEVLDFYHACEHLGRGLAAAYNEGSVEYQSRFGKLRIVLRDDPRGVEKIIRALRHLRDKHPRRKALQRELDYFRRNRHRMRYAALKQANLPIGSGVVEAACKTLVTERLKRSGMRWGEAGGQAVLTFRAAIQSRRFDSSWRLLAAVYKDDVSVPGNVLAFPARVAS